MNHLQFNSLSCLLGGTATVAAIICAHPAIAKTPREVAQVAVPTTVRIDNALSKNNGGSGVIIAKTNNLYTVLTANHVVASPNAEYTIYTSKKKTYPVKSIQSLKSTPGNPDLAVLTFESADEQAVAPLSNSDEATIGSGIYISGYPMAIEVGGGREYEFTAGQVTSRPDSKPEGYTLRYDAVTRRGMSGGPVFDVSGRVVGIHGQGDREGVVKNEAASGAQTVEVKTGFNAAVPINTFLAIAPQVGVKPNALAIDNKPADNVVATQPSRDEVRSWEKDFAMGVGIGIIRSIVPIPIPFFRF